MATITEMEKGNSFKTDNKQPSIELQNSISNQKMPSFNNGMNPGLKPQRTGVGRGLGFQGKRLSHIGIKRGASQFVNKKNQEEEKKTEFGMLDDVQPAVSFQEGDEEEYGDEEVYNEETYQLELRDRNWQSPEVGNLELSTTKLIKDEDKKNQDDNNSLESEEDEEDMSMMSKIQNSRFALFLSANREKARATAEKILELKYFDFVIFSFVFLNSVALSLYDYNDGEEEVAMNIVIDKINIAFTLIFICEAVLRVVAIGIVMHSDSYLRNGWNLIDTIVIVCGILEVWLNVATHKSLRILRVLRPLKCIKSVKTMRSLLSSLIFSLPDFANVGIFLVFVFMLFATMGLHQYNGVLYNTCRYNPAPETLDSWAMLTTDTRVCSKTGLGSFTCPGNMTCGNPSDFSYMTLRDDNVYNRSQINFAITTFDNLGSSLLSVFQMITSDTWQNQLYNLIDVDITIVGAIYCILIITIGQFFLLNLILAVIIQAFIKIQKAAYEERFQEMSKQVSIINTDIQPNPQVGVGALGRIITMMQQKGIDEQTRNALQSNFLNVEPRQMKSFEKSKTSLSDNAAKKKKNKKESKQSDLFKDRQQIDDNAEMHKFLKPFVQKKRIANFFMTLKSAPDPNSQTNMKECFQNDDSSYKDSEHFEGGTSDDQTFEEDKSDKETPEQQQPSSFKKPKPSNMMLALMNKANVPHQFDLTNNSSPAIDKNDAEFKKSTKSTNTIHQRFQKSLRLKIQTKVDNELDKHLTKIITDVKEGAVDGDNEGSQKPKSQSIRQLVGLKFVMQVRQKLQKNIVTSNIEIDIKKRVNANKFYVFAYAVSQNKYFAFFILATVLLNMMILSFDQYPAGDIDQVGFFEKVNVVFTFIYTIEFVLSLTSIGSKYYFTGTRFNILDIIIVVMSYIDIIVSFVILQTYEKESIYNGIGITVLRGFRLLRLFKLARKWKRFRLLLETFGRTLSDVGPFSMLILLILYFYAILGMEFFANKAKFDSDGEISPDGDSPMFNFDDFLNSIFTVFIIITNDGSSIIFYNYFRAVNGSLATVFWISLVVLGQKVLLNLFLAFILEHFDEGTLKEKLQELEAEEQRKINKAMQYDTIPEPTLQEKIKAKFCPIWNNLREKLGLLDPVIEDEETSQQNDESSINKSTFKTTFQVSFTSTTKPVDKFGTTAMWQEAVADAKPVLIGKSLKIFSKDNCFRKFLFSVVTHKHFNYYIIFFILASSVQLAMDSPLNDPNSQIIYALQQIDIITTIVFSFEVLAKSIALGFLFNGPSSYLRQSWNIVDFIIIIFSLLSLTSLSDNLKSVKMLRIFRALRLVTKYDGLKVAVRSLFLAIPNVANVAVIMVMFFFIFGVISVSMFKGKQYICSNNQYVLNFNTLATKWDCINSGGEWSNRVYTFDDIPNALVTLFTMATTVGWSEIAIKMATAQEIDYVSDLKGYRNPAIVIFYVVFMLVGYFFFLNLFVGVVISTFNTEQDKLGGNNLLTERQKEWIDLRLLVLRSQPIMKFKAPPYKIRQFFYRIHETKWFHNFILFCIIVNTLVLCIKWYEEADIVYNATEIINYIFTVIFMCEAFIKIMAIGPKMYFSDGWNIFDFAVMLITFISIFVGLSTSLQIKGVMTVFRGFRIMRIVRLLKRGGRGLSLIFNTFVITLHSLANMGGLLLVTIYMYSILGIIIFGGAKRNGSMNDYINFENFPNAFLTLFIISTGDSWSYTMSDFAMINSPQTQCITNPQYDDYINNGSATLGCGSKLFSYIFFVSYVFIVNLVFVKLFIAIILQGYNKTQMQNQRLFNIDMNEKFREEWAEFDPEASSFIRLSQLRELLITLGEPLGFDKQYHKQKFLQDRFIASLDLPTYHNFTSYLFQDVIDALSFRLMVLDHIAKMEKLKVIGKKISFDSGGGNKGPGSETEKFTKDLLSKEINKLIFQKRLENIISVKEVYDKEAIKQSFKEKNKDKGGLTSSHHMAAEATVRRMKLFLIRRRRERSTIVTGTFLTKGIHQTMVNIKSDEHISSTPFSFKFGNQKHNNDLTNAPSVLLMPDDSIVNNMDSVFGADGGYSEYLQLKAYQKLTSKQLANKSAISAIHSDDISNQANFSSKHPEVPSPVTKPPEVSLLSKLTIQHHEEIWKQKVDHETKSNVSVGMSQFSNLPRVHSSLLELQQKQIIKEANERMREQLLLEQREMIIKKTMSSAIHQTTIEKIVSEQVYNSSQQSIEKGSNNEEIKESESSSEASDSQSDSESKDDQQAEAAADDSQRLEGHVPRTAITTDDNEERGENAAGAQSRRNLLIQDEFQPSM